MFDKSNIKQQEIFSENTSKYGFGIYKIEAITRPQFNPSLPQELQTYLTENNVLIRLFDHGEINRYAFSQLKIFFQDKDESRHNLRVNTTFRNLQAIIKDVARENIEYLNGLKQNPIESNSKDIENLKKDYASLMGLEQSPEHDQPYHYHIIHVGQGNPQTFSPTGPLVSYLACDEERRELISLINQYKENPTGSQNVLERIFKLANKAVESPTKKEVLDLFLQQVSKRDRTQAATYYERHTSPENTYDISVTLTKGEKRNSKSRIIICVDGREFCHQFKSAESRLIFAYTLLKKSQGENFYCDYLKMPMVNYTQEEEEILLWMKKFYHPLGEDYTFESWYAKLPNKDQEAWRPLTNGLYKCVQELHNLLKRQQLEDVISKFVLSRYKDDAGKEYYDIDIPKDHIFIDKSIIVQDPNPLKF